MLFWLSLLAALGCAICNGVAAVLQKISADKQKRITAASVGLLLRLLGDWPFFIGTLLDGLAWILTLIAVHNLPLFVVQPIIALSVVVTALVEHFVFRRTLGSRVVLAIGLILAGLVILASTANAEPATQVIGIHRLLLIFTPVVLVLLGAGLAKIDKPYATVGLAAVSGCAFGGTAVVGRVLLFNAPYWHVLLNPLFIAIVAYGVIGILFFSIALQRNRASVANATMITFETIVPMLIGILILGDAPRHGSWGLVAVGATTALLGTLLITTSTPQPAKARV